MFPGAAPPTKPPSLLLTFLKVGGFVFLCGIVGPIFLVIGLNGGPDQDVGWALWIGALVTAIDAGSAVWLSLVSYRNRTNAYLVRSRGRQVQVRIERYRQTNVEVNDQPLVAITVTLPDGTSREVKSVISLLRIPLLSQGWLTGWWDEKSGGFDVDWEATAKAGGGGSRGGWSPSFFGVSDSDPTVSDWSAPPTVTERLTQLDRLRSTGAISDAEYQRTRARILGSL
jgi:hypothetical protein